MDILTIIVISVFKHGASFHLFISYLIMYYSLQNTGLSTSWLNLLLGILFLMYFKWNCFLHFFFFLIFILFFNFTILYWFCHILKWIHHRYTCVPHPELSSHLPPHIIPLIHPSVFIFSGYVLGSRIAGSYGSSNFIFLRKPQIIECWYPFILQWLN